MSYANPDSEDAAIEQPTIALFAELGWETLNCYHENFGPLSPLGRETMADVVLPNRLKAAIEKLNPGLSPEAVEIAVQELTKDRSAMSPARANQAVYKLLKDGVKFSHKRGDEEDQEEAVETVKLIMGIGESLASRLLLVDALDMEFRTVKLRRDPNCPLCGDNPTISELIDYEAFCGVPAVAV